MEVTRVKLQLENQKTEGGEKSRTPVRAKGDVIFDNEFVVHDVKVLEGSKGLFVGMPAKIMSKEDKRWKDWCHPISVELKKKIDEAVLTEYNKLLKTI